jgi:hypothetical protein
MEDKRSLVLTSDVTLVIPDAAPGAEGYLEVEQDDVGGHTLHLPHGPRFGVADVHFGPRKLTALAWTRIGASFRFAIAREA